MRRLVRRSGDWFWVFPFCTGYDVLAGSCPVRSEELRSNYPFSVWSSKARSWLPGGLPVHFSKGKTPTHMWTQIVGKVRLYSGGGQVRESNREVVRLSQRNT
jgi:hypothetical protein